MKAKRKKLLLAVTALVLAAAIGAGIWFGVRGRGEPVNVFPFRYIGMTEYWGDNQESYGPVSTDKIQTVYLSDTQIVTEIKVAAGDTVKKGDLLMSFDTTLTDIALERKRLDVEKLKLQLEDAQDRLREIRNMKPMVIPDYSDMETDEDVDLGAVLTEAYRVSTQSAYDGSSAEKALICWLNGSTSIDDTLLEVIRQRSEEFQNANAQRQASSASALPEEIRETEAEETVPETLRSVVEPRETLPEETEQEPQPSESTPEPSESTPEPSESEPEPSESTPEPSESEPEPTNPPYVPFEVDDYYVIFKVTEGNMSLGARQVWQGIHVYGKGNSFTFRFFDAYAVADHTLSQDEEADVDTGLPEIDYGSGYTAAQIAEMRSEQEKKIKDLQFDIKMADAEYKIMLTEVSDGNVYSEIDGEVVSVLTEEEAKLQRQPIVKVSGGGGFYVEGSISELEKDKMQIGQEVTINDWNTGMTYTGKVTAIGDFPSTDDGWNGMGNPNASYYPFTAFVDETADLQAGSYTSIQYSTAGTEHGIYLENPFILTQQGRHYVYVRGENGKLEKREVTVGKSLWGSYKEILSGLTEEDLIAFPYGKNLKEGAETVESDLSVLYDY